MQQTGTLPFGNAWAVRHQTDSALMAEFQRQKRPISDLWFADKGSAFSETSEIRIGNLSPCSLRGFPLGKVLCRLQAVACPPDERTREHA